MSKHMAPTPAPLSAAHSPWPRGLSAYPAAMWVTELANIHRPLSCTPATVPQLLPTAQLLLDWAVLRVELFFVFVSGCGAIVAAAVELLEAKAIVKAEPWLPCGHKPNATGRLRLVLGLELRVVLGLRPIVPKLQSSMVGSD